MLINIRFSWNSTGTMNTNLHSITRCYIGSCLASVQSWMLMNKLKLNPNKTQFLLIGSKRQWSKYHSMFPIEIFGVETYPAKFARNVGVIFDKNFKFRSNIYLRFAVLVFTTSGTCSVFAITLIWMVQNCLQMCIAISITVIHFCLVLQILT